MFLRFTASVEHSRQSGLEIIVQTTNEGDRPVTINEVTVIYVSSMLFTPARDGMGYTATPNENRIPQNVVAKILQTTRLGEACVTRHKLEGGVESLLRIIVLDSTGKEWEAPKEILQTLQPQIQDLLS